jgi:sugar lactone lactonase YvrE
MRRAGLLTRQRMHGGRRRWTPSVCFFLGLCVCPQAWADTVYYVAPAYNAPIYQLDLLTGRTSTLVGGASSPIYLPLSLAVGPDGGLYGAGTRFADVYRFSPDGSFVDYFAPNNGQMFFNSYFWPVEGLAFDAGGNLYVSQNGVTGTITKVAPGGHNSTTFASGLNQPQGGVFDPAGNLYVYTSATLSGSVVTKIAPDGTVSQFAPSVYSVLWDSRGDLYTSTANLITITTPNGDVSTLTEAIGRPSILGFGGNGDLYVLDSILNSAYDPVFRVSANGEMNLAAEIPEISIITFVAPEPSCLWLLWLLVLFSRYRHPTGCS